MSELSTKLTDEEVGKVFDTLAVEDEKSTDILNAARETTEETDYTSEDNEEIQTDNKIVAGVDFGNKKYKDIFDAYNMPESDAEALFTVMQEYKSGKTNNLYDRLPSFAKNMVNGLMNMSMGEGMNPRALRNAAAKTVIESFINDEELNGAIEEFSTDMGKTVSGMGTEFMSMVGTAIEDTFNRINEIEAENPEQAEKIKEVKEAFEQATLFTKETEYAKHVSAKKFTKWLMRYKDSAMYFNKRVNSNDFGITINDINSIIPIIKNALPNYELDDIRKFIICITKVMPDPTTLSGIAYLYRMTASINKYAYTEIDDEGKILFNNIAGVIDAILS